MADSLWNVLDKERVSRLAAKATPERTRENAHALFAKMITDSPDPEGRFLEIANTVVRGSDHEIRRQAKALAETFGADTRRLIQFLKSRGVIRKGLPKDG